MKELGEIAAATGRLAEQLREARRRFGTELCVRLPFHASYRPSFDEPANEVQAAMVRWRDALAERNLALHRWLALNQRLEIGELFQMLGFGRAANFGVNWTVAECEAHLGREREVLEGLTGRDERVELLTAKEVARRLGLTRSRVYDLARRKQLPAVWLGRLVRFPATGIEEFLRKGGGNR